MFLTHSDNKHPLSNIYAGTGMAVWTAIEIELRHALYLVEVSQAAEHDSECTMIRTVMLSRSDDALGLYQQSAVDGITPKSISLMFPVESEHGGAAWCIDRLTEVWEADEPADAGIQAKIFAKANGGYFVDSLFRTSLDQLTNWRPISKLSPPMSA
ncbi:hypothetical protein [Comamonas aquatilis]|uniref:hypothetical protein n=1 Tax=Comamonas aquatilis TaxID=1778406 RepID=UPI0039F00698